MTVARSRNSLTSSVLSAFRLAGGLSFSKSSAAVVTDFFRSSRPASLSCAVEPLLTFVDAACAEFLKSLAAFVAPALYAARSPPPLLVVSAGAGDVVAVVSDDELFLSLPPQPVNATRAPASARRQSARVQKWVRITFSSVSSEIEGVQEYQALPSPRAPIPLRIRTS